METTRLIIRNFTVDDAYSVFNNWASQREVQENYAEPVYNTIEEVKELLLRYQKQENRFAIILKENNECIGQIAFFLIDKKNNFAEIEYCIGLNYQNKGYVTEASKEMIKYGFNELKLHRIQICHRVENIKSKRVIEKLGFIYEGTLRDYFFKDNRYQGRCYYSILESEYEEKKND